MAMHKQSPWALIAGGAIALLAVGIGGVSVAEGGPATTPAPPMNALSVEPRVPRLGITPCVVELFRNQRFTTDPDPDGNPPFEYAPPPGCPGPWAKVILSVDMSGPGTTSVANLHISLGDSRRDPYWTTELLVAGAQFNSGQPSWRVERDVTEYSALLRDPRPGFVLQTDPYFRDPCGCYGGTATGRLIFYPATAAQPAPEVPDALVPLPGGPYGGVVTVLPRNIERAYLDIHAQLLPQNWFSCVPSDATASWPLLVDSSLAIGDFVAYAGDGPGQGCAGSNYRDVVVSVDGQVAGVAPLYPWLNSDLNLRFERSVDVPVPTPQSINLIPYRIDLTPFAGLLSDGAPHDIQIRYGRAEGLFLGNFHSAELLMYLDPGSTQVTGQVTRNTLNADPSVEVTTARNDWKTAPNDLLTGDAERLYRRQFEVAGFVNTSKGRVDTTIKQEQLFSSTQHVVLNGFNSPTEHDYAQRLDLASITDRTVLRQRGATVLAFDRTRHHFPLLIDYSASGGYATGPVFGGPYIERASAYVMQGHHKQGGHYRPEGTYGDRLYANFAGGRAYNALTGTSAQWQGARSHYFHDSAGSCYRERVTWLRDVLTSHTQGVGCANGFNRVRGFAHPDGSPDNLGWLR